MAALKSKLPLIIIVAHKSGIVNRQIRVGDSKYGTFDDKFLNPVPIGPKSRNFTLQIFFLLETHRSSHHRYTDLVLISATIEASNFKFGT